MLAAWNLAHRDQLVILAKFGAADWDVLSKTSKLTSFGRRIYAVSPPAVIYPDGTWKIVWVLTRVPRTATFIPAVILIDASDELSPPRP